MAKGGVWYLVARKPEGMRTYRVSRIEEAEFLDQPFERPADFDLAAYWRSSTEELQKSWARYEVTLRVGPRAEVLAPESLRRRVAADLEAAVGRWQATPTPHPEG